MAVREGAAMPDFRQAIETHKSMVYSILWHFLRDRTSAEEIAQDVFLELHKTWKAIQSPAHLVSWLRRVTSHRAIDELRKRKTRPEVALEESNEPTVLERVQDSFLSGYLERMVASLPARVIQLSSRAEYNSAVVNQSSSGNPSLTEIRFGGKKYALQISNEGSGSGSAGAAR